MKRRDNVMKKINDTVYHTISDGKLKAVNFNRLAPFNDDNIDMH